MSQSMIHGGTSAALAAPADLAGRVGSFLAQVAREWRLRGDLARIGELDDRALADIGLGRGEVEDALRHGRGARTRGARARGARARGAAGRPADRVASLMPPSWTEWR